MRRHPNTRPTSIYWLFDTRTNAPFYCGKTVWPIGRRFCQHKRDAIGGGKRPLHQKIRECGENIEIRLIETVPVKGDWVAREKRWIFLLRAINPDACNVVDGGGGAPGYIPSAETRAKISAINKGRIKSAETCAKLSAALKGKVRTAEHCANLGAAKKGKKIEPHSAERRAKLSAIAKMRSPETRAKYSASNKKRVYSADTRLKLSQRVYSAETRLKMSASQKKRFGRAQ